MLAATMNRHAGKPTPYRRPERFLALIGAGLLAACCSGNRPGRQPAVEIQGRNGPVRVLVELAQRDEERRRGLMFRQQMAADRGMLFVYPAEGRHPFWMKNTYLPLDIIYIGSNLRVVEIVNDTQPLSTRHVGGTVPARYVLEVNAGFARRHGIKVGSPVAIRGVVGLP